MDHDDRNDSHAVCSRAAKHDRCVVCCARWWLLRRLWQARCVADRWIGLQRGCCRDAVQCLADLLSACLSAFNAGSRRHDSPIACAAAPSVQHSDGSSGNSTSGWAPVDVWPDLDLLFMLLHCLCASRSPRGLLVSCAPSIAVLGRCCRYWQLGCSCCVSLVSTLRHVRPAAIAEVMLTVQ